MRRRVTPKRMVGSRACGVLLKMATSRAVGLFRASKRILPQKSGFRMSERELYQTVGGRMQPPLYATRSTLESLVLLYAKTLTGGVQFVVLDYASQPQNGRNWHVLGLASGSADREAAINSVKAAAEKYGAWIMVDDGDYRANEQVRRLGRPV